MPASRLKTAGVAAVLFLAFALVGTIDYDEAVRQERLSDDRAASLAAGYCLPRPGQTTVWEWAGAGDAARLECTIFDNRGDREAVVFHAQPAGLDRLALFNRQD